MRGRYYIVNGLMPWSKIDERRIDNLMPKEFMGNAVEKLMQQGYKLDEERMGLFAPDGRKVCSITEALWCL